MAVTTDTLPNGIGLIEVKGSLLSELEAAELREAVAAFVARRWPKLLIDFSETMYLNSTAIGVLVAAHTSYARRKWQLRLCTMHKHVHLIFTITNLMKIFSVYDTREEALKNFS
ncbi:MAG TPA: STAS domain-containing protein [Bacteroidota bacterium]|nr:STAS domain-containing protein [Bacteroidota bacterium]